MRCWSWWSATSRRATCRAALAKALQAVVKQGDLAFEAGRCLYVGQRAGRQGAAGGVRGGRRRLAARGARRRCRAGWRSSRASAASSWPSGWPAPAPLDRAHAEALATAAGDAVYLYRHTKPSAGPAASWPAPRCCAHAPTRPRCRYGLKRGAAIVAGVTLAREVANRPGNHCTPTHARRAGRRAGAHDEAEGRGARPQGDRKARHGRVPRRGARARTSRRASSCCATTAPAPTTRRWCWWARASRSTPAASRSSRPPRWTR